MNTIKFRFILGITAALLLGSVSTSQAADTGIYIGAGLGFYKISNSNLADGDRFEAGGKGLAAVLVLPLGIFAKGGQFWWARTQS